MSPPALSRPRHPRRNSKIAEARLCRWKTARRLALAFAQPDRQLVHHSHSDAFAEPIADSAHSSRVQRARARRTRGDLTSVGDGRLFVNQQNGLIRIIKNDALLATPFLDLAARPVATSGERVLLGLDLIPGMTIREVPVSESSTPSTSERHRRGRFHRSEDHRLRSPKRSRRMAGRLSRQSRPRRSGQPA